MADGPTYLKKPKYFVPHRRYAIGRQSPEQVKAQLANLKRARMLRGQFHNYGTVKRRGMAKSTYRSRSDRAAARAFFMRDITFQKSHPMNVRYLRYSNQLRLRKPRIYGTYRRTTRRLTASAPFKRTTWRPYTARRYQTRIHKRGYRFKQTVRWKSRGNRYTPR